MTVLPISGSPPQAAVVRVVMQCKLWSHHGLWGMLCAFISSILVPQISTPLLPTVMWDRCPTSYHPYKAQWYDSIAYSDIVHVMMLALGLNGADVHCVLIKVDLGLVWLVEFQGPRQSCMRLISCTLDYTSRLELRRSLPVLQR